MKNVTREVFALVIGAGYYGCRIALHLHESDYGKTLLLDKAQRPMTRASFVNQARVHGGYHYPRALDTAYASRKYFERFLQDHSHAITWNTRSVYAIASGSRVSPRQFERVCKEIGAPLEAPPRAVQREFDPTLIDAVYFAEEFAFDAAKIAQALAAQIERTRLETIYGASAKIVGHDGERVIVEAGGERIAAKQVYNCTYSDLESLGVEVGSGLRHELAEIALIRPPTGLENYSVTVMDGPFFSTLPFPSMNAFSLTHVRFTPVISWKSGEARPENLPRGFRKSISGQAMIADAARYLPCMTRARLLGSLFDVKTVMLRRESDDGRPILFEESPNAPGVISVLGSKVDNIYDVLDLIDQRARGALVDA